MVVLKSFIAGICGAVGTAVLWILVSLVLPVVSQMLIARNNGSAGIGAVSIGIADGSVLLAALIGFIVAAGWTFRRSRVVR